MRFSATVTVRLRPGIADPEGATIERAIAALGVAGVSGVRGGRSFTFDVDATDEASATAVAADVATRLLSNPVIEDHSVTVAAR